MDEKQIPEFFREMLHEQYDEIIFQKILDGYKCNRKVTLRINTLKSNKESICEKLRENNIEFSNVSWNENALVIENANEIQIKKLDIYINGEIYLQSLSSMIPPIILNPEFQDNILDMCSAPRRKNYSNGCNV
ncbi:MAG: hypothetical protein HFJ45_06770 [Clostridia bacterium]|nr:hypothetical protein [Clostridia bacterium]